MDPVNPYPTRPNVIEVARRGPLKYSSSESMRTICSFDHTVEILGYVDAVTCTKTVGPQKLLVFSFVVNNGNGERLQVNAWNTEVDRVEHVIKGYVIVHIDGALAKASKIGAFNQGTLNMEISIQSNTMINIMGQQVRLPREPTNENPQLVKLEEIGSTTGYLQIEVFIKSNFCDAEQSSTKSIAAGSGSVTDGVYKLEVRIKDFDSDHMYRKGDHIRINGRLDYNANPTYFTVKEMADITLMDATQMSFNQLLRGTKMVMVKRSSDLATTPVAKKTKKD